MAYSYYTNNTCTTAKVAVNTVTVPASGIVPNSNAATVGSAGTYYWQAVYSGDANNNGDLEPVHGDEQREADGDHRVADHRHSAVGLERHGWHSGRTTRRR